VPYFTFAYVGCSKGQVLSSATTRWLAYLALACGADHSRNRSMYAISRLKRAKNAWEWRVHFRRRGVLYARGFSDLRHGGKQQALAVAIAWRDACLSRVRPLRLREFNAMRRSNNTSGVAGVHFLRTRRQPLGLWQAKVKLPDGRKVHRSFSVRRFGERQAFRLAAGARAALLMQVENRPYLYHRTTRTSLATRGRYTRLA
jgi:hypothetical protein